MKYRGYAHWHRSNKLFELNLRDTFINEFGECVFSIVDTTMETELTGGMSDRFAIVYNWFVVAGRFIGLDGVMIHMFDQSSDMSLRERERLGRGGGEKERGRG